MKKELGKWLLDIAKYMVTALLLSSVFGDIGQVSVFVSVIIASAITLGWGLYLVKENKDTNKKKKGK
ncbi:MAG: DUF6722 family protein [Prevotella sp.]|nr:DUF6722 family protein [Prevotella sp.]